MFLATIFPKCRQRFALVLAVSELHSVFGSGQLRF